MMIQLYNVVPHNGKAFQFSLYNSVENFKCSLTQSFPAYCPYADHWIFGNHTYKVFFSDFINTLEYTCYNMEHKQKSVGWGGMP